MLLAILFEFKLSVVFLGFGNFIYVSKALYIDSNLLGSNLYPFSPSITKSFAAPHLFEDNIGRPKAVISWITTPQGSYILGRQNDYEKTEKYLKRAKDGIKGYVKGKIYQGFASGVKKFINKRGGKV